MKIFARFPGGKEKALTLSYDDGSIQDKRLIEILKPFGIKATFNINSGMFSKEDAVEKGRLSVNQAKELYINSGHEVAAHGLTHPRLEKLPLPIAISEVLEDRKNIESIFGGVVNGMAYPFGSYSEELILGLKNIGMVYSRTTVSTHDFRLPSNWMKLTATCHHNDPDLFKLADKFINERPSSQQFYREPLLFYLWGHSYEFDKDNNWYIIDEFAKKMGNMEKVWYATNIEIYNYIEAYRSLVFSINGKSVYNPSGFTVFFEKDGITYNVEPNETVTVV